MACSKLMFIRAQKISEAELRATIEEIRRDPAKPSEKYTHSL